MALRYALLIALQEAPATGYEITKRFDEAMGYFWQSSHQQIYLELKKMTEKGLVEFEEREQAGKPDKKIYHATEKGLQELKQWLAQPLKDSAFKDALLMKIYAGPLGSPQQLYDEMKNKQTANEKLLQTFHAIESEVFRDVQSLDLQHQYTYLTLRNGIITVKAWLQWCEEVLVFLEKQIGKSC